MYASPLPLLWRDVPFFFLFPFAQAEGDCRLSSFVSIVAQNSHRSVVKRKIIIISSNSKIFYYILLLSRKLWKIQPAMYATPMRFAILIIIDNTPKNKTRRYMYPDRMSAFSHLQFGLSRILPVARHSTEAK